MTVVNTTNSSLSSVNDRWQAFKQGSLTIKKTDLESVSTDDDDAVSFKKQMLDAFDNIDKNGDGISAKELQTYTKAQAGTTSPRSTPPSMTKEGLLAMADRMKADGKTVPDSLQKLIDNFDSADADKNQQVSAEEAQSYAKANGDTDPTKTVGGHGKCHGGHRGKPKAMSKEDLTELSSQEGEDGGTVSDGLQSLIENFDTADVDHDGKISASEAQAFRQSGSNSNVDTTSTSVAASTDEASQVVSTNDASSSQANANQWLKMLLEKYGRSQGLQESSSLMSQAA